MIYVLLCMQEKSQLNEQKRLQTTQVTPTIMDKSGDTFEQNKHFVLPFFRNFKKHLFLSIASTPSPPFQGYNTLHGHFDLVTTLKRGEGVEMSKLDIEKLTRLTKQVFFGECLNYFCPWL